MCLIIASPSGRKPDFSIFEDAARTNSHGIGLAWRVKDKVLFKKGLSLDDLKSQMEGVKESWVAHFRIATVGDKTSELTHPFVISNDSPLTLEGEAESVLFQNGTFSSWDTELLRACASKGIRLPDGDWSDTRAAAVLVSIYGRNILRFIGNHSRYLILANGDKKNPDLVNPCWYTGDWKIHKESGLHFSNGGSCISHTPTTEVRSRPFPESTPYRGSESYQERRESAAPTQLSLTGGRARRRNFNGKSPWTFFGTTGIPEVDGVSESLDVRTETVPEEANAS